ncbi:MAG: L-2-hydroxyglutarate oxidase [Nitrospiraceae bacterium]
MITTDFLVIGGGVIGLSIARVLKKEFADSRVTLIEKEPDCGMHASGRNSGVLHAGFYYTPDSLKAKFTKIGNQMLTAYCVERKIPINRCGKLVVARNAGDHADLDELLKRARVNGIELHGVSEQEAKQIEPRVKTHERALFSPTTSVVNPTEVLEALKHDASREGVEVQCGVKFVKKQNGWVRTSSCVYEAGYVVNASGLHADAVAREFGFGQQYRILPFKGVYLYSDEPAGAMRTNVYPVPDLRNPFLGVHFTVTVDGRTKIGPTAIPAFWREQYEGLAGFSFSEFRDIVRRQAGLLVSSDWDFRRLAVEEIRKYSRSRLIALASTLVDGVRKEHFRAWGRPGIRAQLLNVQRGRLEMDFVVEGDDRSMHVLNAVSPGFTCAIPFAEYVGARVQSAVGQGRCAGRFLNVC